MFHILCYSEYESFLNTRLCKSRVLLWPRKRDRKIGRCIT